MAGKQANAKQGKVVTVTTEERTLADDDSQALPEDDLTTPEQDLIQRLLDEVGGDEDVKFQVYRKAPLDRAGYCTTYQASELSNDRIQEEFGGGKYQVRAFKKGKFAGSTTVSIIEKKGTPVGQQTGVTDLSAILAAIESRKETGLAQMMAMQTDLLKALLTKPEATHPDPMVQQTNFLAMMASIKDLFGTKSGSTDGSVDLLLKGITLGKELGGGGGDGNDMLPVLRAGADLIKPMFEAKNAAPQTAIPTVPVQTSPAPEPGKVMEPADLVSKVLAWVTRQLAFLVDKAKREKDPSLYAELLLDNLPPFVSDEMVATAFAGEDAVERLAKINPEVATYSEWFGQFRTEVIGLLTPDDESDAPYTGEPKVTTSAEGFTPTGENDERESGAKTD